MYYRDIQDGTILLLGFGTSIGLIRAINKENYPRKHVLGNRNPLVYKEIECCWELRSRE